MNLIRCAICVIAALCLGLSCPSASGPKVLLDVEGAPVQVDLSAAADLDWVHWGHTDATSVNRQATPAVPIGALVELGGAAQHAVGGPTLFSWDDGAPLPSEPGTPNGIEFSGVGGGFELTVPSTDTYRVLHLWLGGSASQARIEASVSGPAAPAPVQQVIGGPGGDYDHVVEIQFRSAVGQTLTVRCTLEDDYGGPGTVRLSAAALIGVKAIQAPTITPAGGAFLGTQQVSIDTATPQAVITYTTDGSVPDELSTLYAGPFLISGDTTVQAIAFRNQWQPSSVTSAFFDDQLPLTDDFEDGVLDGWSISDETLGTPDWQIVSGRLVAANQPAQFRQGSFRLGSHAHLDAGAPLQDYRVEADFHTIWPGEDIGLVFRRQDDDNYYRLSLYPQSGFTRLDKKTGGAFTSLAANARGHVEGQSLHVAVEVVGEDIFVEIDGESIFAVRDTGTTLLSGTAGVSALNNASFDNFRIEAIPATPRIAISQPISYHVDASDTLVVSALTRNTQPGDYVEFLLDEANSQIVVAPPWTTSYTTTQGRHSVRAILRNGGGALLDEDLKVEIGVLGEPILSGGDSIAWGQGDSKQSDNQSADGGMVAVQGHQATLNDLLTGDLGAPYIVFNEAIAGLASSGMLTYLPEMLARYPGVKRLTFFIGTNDSFGMSPVMPGLGCVGAACDGTFKGNVQGIIDLAVGQGIEVAIAQVPPAFGATSRGASYAAPLTEDRNKNYIEKYNQIIRTELTSPDPMLPLVQGPDLYTLFLPDADDDDVADVDRFSVFQDNVHLSALGNHVLALEWRKTLNPAVTDASFMLDDLVPSGYKQTLMEPGDPYLLDAAHTVTAAPASFLDGIWILGNEADAGDTSSSFLSFDVANVDRDVIVSVAYDDEGQTNTLPVWLDPATSSFGPPVGTLTTDDPNAPSMAIYELLVPASPTGSTVTLGGNLEAPASGADAPYVVSVREVSP